MRSRDYRWNGFTDPSPAPRDFTNIERFEVLKGPASILYGSGQPAGVVNIITVKPQETAASYVGVQVGNYNLMRAIVGTTGALDDEGRVLARFSGDYQNSDSFRDFGFDEHVLVAPAITWVLDKDTSLAFEGQYLHDRRQFDTGVVALNNMVGSVPISRSFNEPGDRQVFNDYKTAVWLTHRFAEDWTGRLGFYAGWYDAPSNVTAPVNIPAFQLQPIQQAFNLPASTILRQTQVIDPFSEQYYSIIADLAGKVQTGPFVNKFVVGTELGWFNSSDFVGRLTDPLQPVPLPTPFGVFNVPFPSAPLNALAPVDGQAAAGPLVGKFDSAYTQERYGFYFQDLVDLTHGLKLLAGVRGDIVNFSFARELSAPFAGTDPLAFARTEQDSTYYHLTPRVGLLYEAVPEVLSFYTSYSESFDPPPGGEYQTTAPLSPETGRSIEAGVKADLLDKKLSLAAAGFYIVKDNVVTQNSLLFATQVGEQRGQGVELSAVGKLTDQWSIIANYSYIDSRITKEADPTLVGVRFRGVPYNSANLWTRYNLIQSETQTFGVAAGLVYVGNRGGDLQDSFELPGYTRCDAGVYYKRGMLDTSVYVENVFDRQYYSSSVDSVTIFPGSPVTFRATIGLRF